ncbi:MAG: hypothetical protein EAX96_10645, partial [Candidatus Lokiarchaeota archaeon]|nr:hypothetical protein [Candidatus Lokiarchaeota archaeon]
MSLGIYIYAQILVAILSIINLIKLSTDYKKEKEFIILFLIGFFIINVIMAIIQFLILFYNLETFYFWILSGRTLMRTILILMISYLFTVSLYILDFKKLYFIPVLGAIILIVISIFFIQIFEQISMYILIAFVIPTIILFFYAFSKKRDGVSLSFAIFLIIESIMGPLQIYAQDFSGILHIVGNVIVFLGVLGI